MFELLLFSFFTAGGLFVDSTLRNSSDPSDGRQPQRPPSYPPQTRPGSMAYYPHQHAQQRATYAPEVRLQRQSNGHFYARAQIGGREVTMLVDTGCTGVVVDRATAAALGVRLDRVRYDLPVHAGNGTLYAHHFYIPEMTVEGRLTARNVEAVVHQAHEDDGRTLLGMSFLQHFRVSIAGGEMVIGE